MTDVPRRTPDYRPIRDYGVIGNQSSTALVRVDGSIDWCCLPYLDSPSVLGALLDAGRGGYFLVRPASSTRPGTQRYVPATNVLVTAFEEDGGRVEILDFMPLAGTLMPPDDAPDPPELQRHIRCTDGRMQMDVVWCPRLDYGRGETEIEPSGAGFVALGGGGVLGLAGLEGGTIIDTGRGPAVVGRLALDSRDTTVLRMVWDERDPEVDPREAGDDLAHAIETWRSWADRAGGDRGWAGEWKEQVLRSELFLKLMTQPYSGALAAAPTTSLPETLGGVRNWDYRYAWIRDAAQIAQAFFAVGHPEHADAFIAWAEAVASRGERKPGTMVPILHPLRPESGVEEVVLDHFEGYRRSAPVRVGNRAVEQLQLDVYGEILNLVFERTRLGGRFDPEVAPFLEHLADEASDRWHLPDFGIWEMKNGPFHQVYSKVMSWVALHRAGWLRERGHIDGDLDRWSAAMKEIREEVLRYGYNEELGAFVQSYGGEALDAANLLIPLMEFLPYHDPKVQGTIDRTLERLVVNGLVYRYRAPDGLPGEEGCFILCTCWLVDALALSHRLDEANGIFEGIMGRTNHLDLLAEQMDPYSGEFLGNFPQAYSHLGVINSALYLAAREGRELPVAPLLGAREDS